MSYDFILEKLVDIDAKANVLTGSNDIRNADLYALIFREHIRYVSNRQCWYYYDGVRWQKDDSECHANELLKRLAEALKKYCREYVSSDSEINYTTIANKWSKRTFRDTVLRDAKTVCAVNLEEFDKDPYLLNLNNGTLNLRNGELQPHNADDLITKLAPVDFVQDYENERWTQFIDEIMSGDKDKAQFLQKALGYAIGGSTKEECMFILYGETTRNGKGTLMESVISVLGDYARTVKPETIAQTQRSANAPNEDVARLKGTRLANISEPPKTMVLNSALVKTLTGGDTINARFLHENSFDFLPQFKLFVNTNYLPQIDDTTVFNSGRIHLIPFDRHFSKEEQDKGLKELFRSEECKSGILNWLIMGYYMALCGLDQPEAVAKATEEYRSQSDHVYHFLNTVLTPDPAGKLPMSDVYKLYTDWCRANQQSMLAQIPFSKRVKQFATIDSRRIGTNSFRCILGYKKLP